MTQEECVSHFPSMCGLFILIYSVIILFKEYKKGHSELTKKGQIIFLSITPWVVVSLIDIGFIQPQWIIHVVFSSSLLIFNALFIKNFVCSEVKFIKRTKSQLSNSLEKFIIDIEDQEVLKSLNPLAFDHNFFYRDQVLQEGDALIFDYVCQYFNFSAKEYEIAKQIKADFGVSIKEIAKKQNISVKTVDCHIANIYQKASVPKTKHWRVRRVQLVEKLSILPTN